jgi:AraC-like DNA-binding protein
MISPLTGHADNTLKASVQWFRYMLDAIAAEGIDAAAIAAECGLDCKTLHDPEAAISDEFSHLLIVAATRHAGDPDFALKAGRHHRVTALGALGYAMMASADLRAALLIAERYTSAVTQAVSCRVQVCKGKCRIEFPVRPYTPQVARQPQEFLVTALLGYLQWLVGRPLLLTEVAFMHPRPKSVEIHTETFGILPIFDAKQPSLSFDAADLDLPIVTADKSIAPLLERFAAERSKVIGQPSYTQQTRRCIISALASGQFGINEIARRLNISGRTLQRHLNEEGVNFNALLDDIRRDLLALYLNDAQMPLKEIATRLGFSSHSSFSRAVRRWHAQSPSMLRRP